MSEAHLPAFDSGTNWYDYGPPGHPSPGYRGDFSHTLNSTGGIGPGHDPRFNTFDFWSLEPDGSGNSQSTSGLPAHVPSTAESLSYKISSSQVSEELNCFPILPPPRCYQSTLNVERFPEGLNYELSLQAGLGYTLPPAGDIMRMANFMPTLYYPLEAQNQPMSLPFVNSDLQEFVPPATHSFSNQGRAFQTNTSLSIANITTYPLQPNFHLPSGSTYDGAYTDLCTPMTSSGAAGAHPSPPDSQGDDEWYECMWAKCDKCYRRLYLLVDHVAFMHRGTKRHLCPVEGCAGAYVAHAGLMKHLKTDHIGLWSRGSDLRVIPPAGKGGPDGHR